MLWNTGQPHSITPTLARPLPPKHKTTKEPFIDDAVESRKVQLGFTMAFESLADSDDPRDIELSSLSAIYPEIEPDPANARAFFLELPVKPAQPVKVFFPAPVAATVPDMEPGQPPGQPRDNTNGNAIGEPVREDSHELSYLPSVRLRISLPDSYPAELPPRVELGAVPSWIPTPRVEELVAECANLWEELGRDSVVFAYIDCIQQLAENAFGVADDEGTLSVDLQHKIAILDYDISAKRAAFERETFDCGVCLDPKKGSVCHRMLDCGHVFCSACLQDFYNNAIKEGDISSVRCLSPNCAKEREALAAAAGIKKRKKPKLVSPSELLQIPLDHDAVKRYVTLKYKSELESDKNTVYCPRSWCNGAVRSKRHRKPEGLEFSEGSDESGDEADGANAQGSSKTAEKAVAYNKTEDLLAICEDCGFAFCSRCYLSWHGEFFRCTARREKEELSAEEKASLEYMNLHTTPCPTCAAPAQKTQGCNHMICGRQGCETHFCYLCSAWLDPTNPYSHYNQQPGGRITGCFGRLWELEEGDGDDVDLRFAGGAAGRRPAPAVVDAFEPELDPALLIPEIEEADDHGEPRDGAVAEAHQGPNRGHAPPNNNNNEDVARRGVALEAPLVLRIDVDPPAPPAVPMPPPVEAAGGRQQNARGRGAGRAGRDGQNARRGRGNQGPNQQHRDAGPARNNAAAGRGRGGRAPRGAPAGAAPAAAGGRRAPEPPDEDGDEDLAEAQLNEAQRAWVRQFVQMALNDQEDLVESDSDDDEEEMVFWIP
ncbi:hypothetical protein RB596_002626 [Gaeumannomyces avenae]